MRKALVLVNTNLGSEREVEAEVKKILGVTGVYHVYGVYDMVIEVESASDQDLKDVIFSKIRTLKNVRSTLTLTTTS